MLCAARAEVGPLGQSFWILWDRERRRHHARTTLRPGQPRAADGRAGDRDRLARAAGQPAARRLRADRIDLPQRRRLGLDAQARRRADRGHDRGPRPALEIEGRGVDDESAGYHQRRTSWRWSAGIGSAADGRALAWNLVEGVNDPAERSERAIWVEGEPSEPAPVRFDGLSGIDLAAGRRLEFASESAHARDENLLLFSSRYRHRFGSFSGHLGGLELASGLGVMEEHDAVW